MELEEQKIKAIRRLHGYGSKSHDIAFYLNLTCEQVDLERNQYERELEAIERDYVVSEWPKVSASIQDIKDHALPELKRVEYERLYMLEQITAREATGIKDDDKQLQTMYSKAKILTGRLQGMNPQRVALAKQYPLADLVKKTRNGMSACPFHEDKTPSMDIRKNFFHCYSCGEHGDPIDYVMKTENLSFRHAVERLT